MKKRLEQICASKKRNAKVIKTHQFEPLSRSIIRRRSKERKKKKKQKKRKSNAANK